MSDGAQRVRRARTLLFVPAARPDRFARALATQADLVVIDLEASVRPVDKARAREAACAWLAANADGAARVLVRVNPVDSPWFGQDVAALRTVSCAGVLQAMANSVHDVATSIAAIAPGLPLVALVETAAGVLAADEVARVAGVARLAFGNMDYATDTGTRGRDARTYPSARLVIASRAAGLPPPIAGVTSAFRDGEALEVEAGWERDQGFGGKLCIHPEQLPIVARVFAPGEADLAWARRVVAAAGESYAFEIDGELVDRPVIERARRLLDGD